MRRTGLVDRLLLSAALVLASATAACTADTRPVASDFELRSPSGGETDEDVTEDEGAPPEGADRARLAANPGPLLVLRGTRDTAPATKD